MTLQETKQYLQQYRDSIDRTAEIEHHLRELKAEAINLQDHDGQSVRLDDATAKYVDACNELSEELGKLEDLRSEIYRTIDSVPDAKLRSVLHWRYICGYSWEQVAVELSYTYRRITQLHGDALQQVEQIMAKR